MADGWTHIRVRASTLAQLQDECRRLAAAVSEGATAVVDLTDRVGRQQGCGVSADQVIRLMLAARERHRKRRRKNKTGSAEVAAVLPSLVGEYLATLEVEK